MRSMIKGHDRGRTGIEKKEKEDDFKKRWNSQEEVNNYLITFMILNWTVEHARSSVILFCIVQWMLRVRYTSSYYGTAIQDPQCRMKTI